MKKMILLLGALMVLPTAVFAAPVTPAGQVFYNTAGSNFSHDMQNLNRQRREFEGNVNYKQEQRRQAADQQVQQTFDQIRNRTTQQGNLQFVQTSDGRIIIKRVD